MKRPAVLGGGSWGTALALVLARRGLPVNLWVRDAALAAGMGQTRFNHSYLPGFPLPDSIRVETSLRTSVTGADCIVFATPSHALRAIASQAAPHLSCSTCLISAAKGIEEETLCRMSEVLSQTCGGFGIAALSGPSFAREVAQELPAALVAASTDWALAQAVQHLFSGSRFRVYASRDLPGVEWGGAMKNVIAIAAGVCHGLNLGHNALAALITRGLAEMSRLACAFGAEPKTLAGLSGLGDLVLSCTGELSRNRRVGIQLASGLALERIVTGMKSVAEGIRTTNSVIALGMREDISLPISQQMHAVLHGLQSPASAIEVLMERSLRGE